MPPISRRLSREQPPNGWDGKRLALLLHGNRKRPGLRRRFFPKAPENLSLHRNKSLQRLLHAPVSNPAVLMTSLSSVSRHHRHYTVGEK
ncbi:hypothetical protein SLA2020_183240 [Shorea laevis]